MGETPRRHLAAARMRVADDRFNLVVLGEFKRGKSTLINALLGRDVLPIGVVPLTSVVTAIAAGDETGYGSTTATVASRSARSASWPTT